MFIAISISSERPRWSTARSICRRWNNASRPGVGELRRRRGSLFRRLRLQRRRHRFLDSFEPDELHLAARDLGNVVVVAAVACWQHDALDAGGVRRDDLLLDAADRQYQAAK